MPKRVLISYRRGLDSPSAARVHDRLERILGRSSVFMDVDAIPPGEKFKEYLENQVALSSAIVVVIGRGWLSDADRLFDSGDFVRIEVEQALSKENALVIPLLVDGAELPPITSLPQSLRPLVERSAIEAPHLHFSMIIDGKLAKALKQKISPSWLHRLPAELQRGRSWLAAILVLLIFVTLVREIPQLSSTAINADPVKSRNYEQNRHRIPQKIKSDIEHVFSDDVLNRLYFRNADPIANDGILEIINSANRLREWELHFINRDILILGWTDSDEIRDNLLAKVDRLSSYYNRKIRAEIRLYGNILGIKELLSKLNELGDCGSIYADVIDHPDGLANDIIEVTGYVSSNDKRNLILEYLKKESFGRRLDTSISVFEDYACKILELLPDREFGGARIFYDRSKSERSGMLFSGSEVPIIKLAVKNQVDGYVYAFLADNEGQVIHLIPHQYRPINKLSEIKDGGANIDEIRLTVERDKASRSLFSIEFLHPFGGMMVFALITDEKLFEGKLRPRAENSASFYHSLRSWVLSARGQRSLLAYDSRRIIVDE